MLWLVAIAFAGIGLAFVKVRRRRKGPAGASH